MGNIDPWKYVKVGDVTNNPYFKKGEATGDTTKQGGTGSQGSVVITNGIYELLPQADTYAKGVAALKKSLTDNPSSVHPQFTLPSGSQIFRPLTFKQNIEARVTEYDADKNQDGTKRTEEQKLELFNTWIDSCAGIAYEKKTTQFKIIPICETLINIPEDFKDSFHPTEYSKLIGTPLDSSSGIYNTGLSHSQALEHPAWIAAVEGDKTLLKSYADITFKTLKSKYNQDAGMGFYVGSNTKKDELRVLYVISIDYNSVAIGYYILNNKARFLRVAQRAKK